VARSGLALLCLLALLGSPTTALAQASLLSGFGGTAGYGTSCLGKNDDQSSPLIDLSPYFPAGLQFFDRTHTSVYVNTNGNVSFSGAVGTFTPNPFPVADQPMIAPYWADVDLRQASETCETLCLIPALPSTCTEICTPLGCDGSGDGATGTAPACHNPADNGVWWTLEAGRMVVTWDRVGYYQCHDPAAQRMSFQLVLTTAPTCGGPGDFDVEFRYNRCEWEAGDASGGTNGFGGTAAQAGFDAGNSVDFVAIDGSRVAGIASALCTGSNVGEAGIWRYQIRSGVVLCPEAGTPCDSGELGVCAGGRMQCAAAGISCVAELMPSAETCDALDNDCDGSVDEDPDLCAGAAVCDRGVCVEACFEGGCNPGELCNASGSCIEAACEGVVCAAGERCSGGACVGACDGITCPASQICRAGRCVDLCATLTCDECTVCVDGSCEPRCEYAACAAGAVCQADGLCLENACVGVSCGAGTHCEAGSCVDDCLGATCAAGEICEAGACVPMPAVVMDAGVPPVDAGPVSDGSVSFPDGSAGDGSIAADGGDDAGRIPGGRSDAGCACRLGAASGGGDPAPLLGFLGLFGLVWRRRRR